MSVEEMLNCAFDGAEPQTDLGVGDRVRSYDFAGVFDHYVEGVIEGITGPMEGCPRYKLRVHRRVAEGYLVESPEDYVYPPVNGTPTLMGKLTNFVVRAPPH